VIGSSFHYTLLAHTVLKPQSLSDLPTSSLFPSSSWLSIASSNSKKKCPYPIPPFHPCYYYGWTRAKIGRGQRLYVLPSPSAPVFLSHLRPLTAIYLSTSLFGSFKERKTFNLSLFPGGHTHIPHCIIIASHRKQAAGILNCAQHGITYRSTHLVKPTLDVTLLFFPEQPPVSPSPLLHS
jgi:hypothetical protein